MTIDEHTRHAIHTWMVDSMGTARGDGLMSMLGAIDRRLTEAMRATFFASATLLLTVTTIIVSVVLATR